jgi:hypothetical protein
MQPMTTSRAIVSCECFLRTGLHLRTSCMSLSLSMFEGCLQVSCNSCDAVLQ